MSQPIPGVDEYATELQRNKKRYHRVCSVCCPEPTVGDIAVCGSMILGEKASPGKDLPCEACIRTWPVHVREHFGGRPV